jgi:typhasterol/6-deoxotyphasterol 2alpha-hydroxylase
VGGVETTRANHRGNTFFAILRKLKAKSGQLYNLSPLTPWPVIGNFNLISALPHRSIHELSKKHDPLMHLRFGSFPVIISSSVDVARYFLKIHDLLFLDRAPRRHPASIPPTTTPTSCSCPTALTGARRTGCASSSCSARAGSRSFEHIGADEVRNLFAASGRTMHLNRDHLSTLSMNVITRMVLGKRFCWNRPSALLPINRRLFC